MKPALLSRLKRHVAPGIKEGAYNAFRSVTSRHRPGTLPNVFIFTTPRSGSTWLMELIWSQPGFRCVNEPLDVRDPLVARSLGISSWEELVDLPPAALTKLHSYFQRSCEGRIHTAEPAPFRNRFYRYTTQQTVFKVLHGGEDRLNWFRDSFNGRVVYFIRHPVAVSLSRKVFPRLQAFINTSYADNFTDLQLREAQRIVTLGSHLERGVLDWCFQNALPLRQMTPDWALLTYEQLVLEPEVSVQYLADKLELADTDKIYNRLGDPSGVLQKSDAETQGLLREGATQKRSQLVSKWRSKVSASQEQRAMDILALFDMSAYSFGDLLPAESLWLRDGYDPAQQPSLPLPGNNLERRHLRPNYRPGPKTPVHVPEPG